MRVSSENEFSRDKHTFRSAAIIKVVGEAVDFLINSPVHQLPPVRFDGAGICALYYTGAFEAYTKLAAMNRDEHRQPIYAGKAALPGWRQARSIEASANSLYNRLRDQARNIGLAKNLTVSDFACRFVIREGQESNLISIVESELIRRFTPLWNSVVDGFGNHDPGLGRYNQSPSEWDTLHPGRSWVKKLKGKRPTTKAIVAKIVTRPTAPATCSTGRWIAWISVSTPPNTFTAI